MEQIEQIIEKWDEILNTVKEEHEISEVSFNTWLKPLSVFAVENNKLYILVPDEQIGLISPRNSCSRFVCRLQRLPEPIMRLSLFFRNRQRKSNLIKQKILG